MQFTRSLSKDAIDALRADTLFEEKLRPDCENGVVFPAIRQNRVDFYHKGGKLFSWTQNNGFSTHHKYASVLTATPEPKDYICESALLQAKLVGSFREGYERIKENCALYSGVEASGVAGIYHGFSCAAKNAKDVVVLDIEVAFSKQEEEAQGHDRIDFVTLDYATGKLRFFEAKHYSNRTSLRNQDNNPALCHQLKRYDEQLQKLHHEIIAAYCSHVSGINSLFDLAIPLPTDIDPTTRAIIFGFDAEQKAYLNSRVVLKENGLFSRTYTVAEIKKGDLPTIFRGGKQNWE